MTRRILFLLTVFLTVPFLSCSREPDVITNSIGMKLKRIPPGEFMMGSGESLEAVAKEFSAINSKVPHFFAYPQHRVRITTPYYLGVYEVTQAEYQKVMGDDPSESKGTAKPVEMVSWQDAEEFCKKLSAKEGRTYRLPTEAEWEYACRAGTTTRYSFGDDWASLGEHAWYEDNSDAKTHPVGQKKSNAWGLHDMHGNGCEWCQDWHTEYYRDDSPAVDDPTGEEGGSERVVWGGSWFQPAWVYPSAARLSFYPDDTIGFRVAADASGR